MKGVVGVAVVLIVLAVLGVVVLKLSIMIAAGLFVAAIIALVWGGMKAKRGISNLTHHHSDAPPPPPAP